MFGDTKPWIFYSDVETEFKLRNFSTVNFHMISDTDTGPINRLFVSLSENSEGVVGFISMVLRRSLS
jgi:hypothetical protein